MPPARVPPPPPNRARLFLAACTAMVTLAMTFAIRADILAELGREFNISHTQQGLISTASSTGYLIAMIAIGPLVDVVGLGRLFMIACGAHLAGIGLTILSPAFGFPALLLGILVIGLADGAAEAVMNPLAAALYPEDTTGRISILHAGWPAGLIIGGLGCLAITPLAGPELGWKIKMSTALAGALAYGALAWGQRFPRATLARHGAPPLTVVRLAFRPGFLLLLLCMLFTSVTEVGPYQWIGSVMRDTVGIPGVAFMVYMSAIMFVMRMNGGRLVRRFTPFGLLTGSCALSCAGLFWLSTAITPWSALGATTLFAIGSTCLWPTLLGVAAERSPRGRAFLLSVLSSAGMWAGGAIGPVMGRIYDRSGAAMTIRFAAWLPVLPGLIYGALALRAKKAR